MILSAIFIFESNTYVKAKNETYTMQLKETNNKDIEFEWPSLDNNINNKTGFCYGLKTHIGILSDGTVVPCCLDQDGIINLGNIFNQEIDEILSSEKTVEIIENFKQNKRIEKLCQHCSFKR